MKKELNLLHGALSEKQSLLLLAVIWFASRFVTCTVPVVWEVSNVQLLLKSIPCHVTALIEDLQELSVVKGEDGIEARFRKCK